MELHRIVDTIYLIPAEGQGGCGPSHAVYVDGKRKILFDCGAGTGTMQAFFKQFKVDVYIASHAHPCHAASLWMLNRASVPIFVPAESRDCFGDITKIAQRSFTELEPARIWMSAALKLAGYKNTTATHSYDGKSSFDLEDLKLLAIHTPGHSQDHYCFFEEKHSLLLGFDVDLAPDGPRYGFSDSDIPSFDASLELLKSYNAETYVSSHRGVLRKNVNQALSAFQGIIRLRDEKIMAQLKAGPRHTSEFCGTGLFFRSIPDPLRPLYLEFERIMLGKHFEILMEQGLVGKTKEGWQLS